MSRFTDDIGIIPGPPAEPRRELRRAAQQRAYGRWEQEMLRKYRGRLDQLGLEGGDRQDSHTVEALVTEDDLRRLSELLEEELRSHGGTII